jgi:hypothetical protein
MTENEELHPVVPTAVTLPGGSNITVAQYGATSEKFTMIKTSFVLNLLHNKKYYRMIDSCGTAGKYYFIG